MSLNKSLQKPEESVRRPQAIDDTVLLGLLSNSLRQVLAEVSAVTLVDTVNAITSQIRQIMYGLSPGQWSDIPPSTLADNAPRIFVVPASSSLTLYTTPLADFISTKFFMGLHNATALKWETLEMLAGKETPTKVNDTVFARIGFPFNLELNFSIVGSDVSLVATNNEVYPITVNLRSTSF